MTGMLEGKVVVVTGAGRGIGRAIALMSAAQGARVVVNDLGGSAGGGGADPAPAHSVVAEIRDAGGEAIANVASAAQPDGCASIIEDAVRGFGRVDAVVNNAGFLRDRIFHRMSIDDWDDVIGVHLSGYFYLARAASQYFKDQGSGAYLHFTSTSGLIGNFGQANYAAAKLGVVGLSTSIALDMRRYGVRSNCIAPTAWSRLIETVPAETEDEQQQLERLKRALPEHVAPLAVLLCSDAACNVSGQIFGVRGNEVFLYSRPQIVRTAHHSNGWTVETLAAELLPMMEPSFEPLRRTADVIAWDPI